MQITKASVMYLLILVLVLSVLGGITYTVHERAERAEGIFKNDLEAADFAGSGEASYTDLNGTPVSLSSFKGAPLIVNSWASWCPFCVEELPLFEEIGEAYKEDGLGIIAMNRKESAPTASAFIEHVGNPTHITFLLDPSDRFYTSIGGYAMPETVFYDRDGNVVLHRRGAMSKEEIEKALELLFQ